MYFSFKMYYIFILFITQVRTRTRGINDSKSRLTVEELQLFANQLDTLPAKGIRTNIQKSSCN